MCNDLFSFETIALRCTLDRKDVREYAPGIDYEDDESVVLSNMRKREVQT